MIKAFRNLLRAAGLGAAAGNAGVSPLAVAAGSVAPFGTPVAAAAIEAAAAADPARRVLLLPMGTIALRDGRGPFRLDDLAHAEAVVAASLARAGGTDLVIDYDHQTHFGVGKDKGGRAVAAGWIKDLAAGPDGISARIEWTPAATAALADREYRYISPLFYPDAAGRVALLRNAGLVNEPAITDLPAIAAASQETDTVDLSKIAAALGLAASATMDDIIAAIAAMAMPKDKMMVAAAALGLPATAGLAEIVAAATTAASAEPDPSKFVPVAVLTETTAALNARLAVLEGDRNAGVIAAASEAGKLTPGMEPWAREYLAKDAAGFKAWLDAAPVIVAAGAMLGPDAVADDAQFGLTADEMAVARQMGVSLENFANAKKG